MRETQHMAVMVTPTPHPSAQALSLELSSMAVVTRRLEKTH